MKEATKTGGTQRERERERERELSEPMTSECKIA